MKTKTKNLFALKSILLLSAMFCIRNSFGQEHKMADNFPVNAPEQQGMNSAVLDSMLTFIRHTHQDIHQLTIIRNNHTLFSANFYPYAGGVHDLASVTKSITSLLVGIAIDKGNIKDEEEPVLKFFPEIKNPNSYLQQLKIKDLLIMSSGFDCNENSLAKMRSGTDWVNYIFRMPFSAKPGEAFNYCSCNFYLLAEVIKRTTGLIPHDFAKKYLFGPLQITDSKWLINYKGINHGWGDLFLSPADMAKIGVLMLNDGAWKNKQIVSTGWIKKSEHTYLKTGNEGKGYGYGWWTNDEIGYIEAAGRGRQAISIVPSKNVVVTMLGSEFDAGAIGTYIFKALQSDKPLPANILALQQLNTDIRAAATASQRVIAPVNEQLIDLVNKHRIVLGKNVLGIDTVQFDFDDAKTGKVTIRRGKDLEVYSFVCSRNSYKIGMDKVLNLPVAFQVYSENGNELVLHYNQLNRINNIYLKFKLSPSGVKVTLEETSNFYKTSINAGIR